MPDARTTRARQRSDGPVAVFLPSLRGGGAERATLRLVGGLADRGTDVTLVAADATGPLLQDVPPGVDLVDLHASRVRYSVVPMSRLLRRLQPDVLLCVMSQVNTAGIVARDLARTDTRVVVSERSTPSEVLGERQPFNVRVQQRTLGISYRRADAVVAVSRGAADDISLSMGIPIEEIHVIYNPVVSVDLYRLATIPPSHGWLTDGGPPVLLSAGRLVPSKDFPTLLRAFRRVLDTRSARLIILGDGPERQRLAQLSTDLELDRSVLDLVGFVVNPYPFMQHAQLFVLSSRYEGMPNALVEAAALGTPVVSTDCPSGPRELLGDDPGGRLVELGDVEGMATAIHAQLDDPRPVPGSLLKPFHLDEAVSRYLDVLRPTPRHGV